MIAAPPRRTRVPPWGWPRISERFPGVHPGLARVPPEEGGLTYLEIDAYVDALEDYPPTVPVVMVEPQ